MNPVVPGSGLLILKLALSLGLVVGLILMLQKAARKWGRALGAGSGPEAIRLLTQRSVGPRLSLAVIEVRGRTLLVGISPQGIQKVADLDAPATPDPGAVGSTPPELVPALVPPFSFDRGPQAADRPSASPAPGDGGPAPDPPLTAPAPRRRFWERWSRPARGAGAAVPPAPRSARPRVLSIARTQVPAAVSPADSPAVFEDELQGRLASLRERYPSLADLESEVAEALR